MFGVWFGVLMFGVLWALGLMLIRCSCCGGFASVCLFGCFVGCFTIFVVCLWCCGAGFVWLGLRGLVCDASGVCTACLGGLVVGFGGFCFVWFALRLVIVVILVVVHCLPGDCVCSVFLWVDVI